MPARFIRQICAFLSGLWSSARLHALEFAFGGTLLLLAGVILAIFRPYPLAGPIWTLAVLAAGLIITGGWWAHTRALSSAGRMVTRVAAADVLALAAIVAITLIVFLPLMRLHFETGTDTTVGLGADMLWMDVWTAINRPMVGFGSWLALKLTPARIDGFFIVVLAGRAVTALCLYGLMRVLIPAAGRFVAMSAGLLFIMNPAELGRFNLWSIWYVVPVACLAGSALMFVDSYRRSSRLGLVASVALLGFTFLQYEHGYPIAAMVPFLLLALPRRSHLPVWLFLWYGTVAVFALRMVTYLIWHGQAYQLSLFTTWVEWPKTIGGYVLLYLGNAWTQFSPTFRFLDLMGADPHQIGLGLAVAAGVFLVLLLLRSGGVRTGEARPRRLLGAGLVAFIFACLGVLLFLPLPVTKNVPDYGTNPTLRYQFFAGLGQAVFWSCLAGALAAFIRTEKLRHAMLAALIALLIGSSVISGLAYQSRGGVLNPYYRWDTATSVFRAVDAALPEMKSGDVIFLEVPENEHSPIGWGYSGFHLSCIVFGAPAIQGRMAADGTIQQRVFGYAGTLYAPSLTCGRLHHFKVDQSGKTAFQGTIERPGTSTAPACSQCVMRKHPRAPGAPAPFIGAR